MRDKYFYILRTRDLVHIVCQLIVELFNKGGDVLWEVTIRIHRANRSKQQNAYYWVIMKLVGDYFGYTDEEMHEYFKGEFLTPNESLVMGAEITIYPTTTKLNTKEFNEYLELIARFCAEQGFVVPPPIAYGYEWGGANG